MTDGKQAGDWLAEFKAFMSVVEEFPPRKVTDFICAYVRADLEPSTRAVIAKAVGLHAVTTILAIAVCPQLGAGPLLPVHGFDVFMRFGALPCAFFCGALFLAFSAIFLSLGLRRNELRVVLQHGFLGVTFLSAISFATLMLSGGESDRIEYAIWLLGAVIGGWSVLRTAISIRLHFPIRARYVLR